MTVESIDADSSRHVEAAGEREDREEIAEDNFRATLSADASTDVAAIDVRRSRDTLAFTIKDDVDDIADARAIDWPDATS
jgi:hypothetical protein